MLTVRLLAAAALIGFLALASTTQTSNAVPQGQSCGGFIGMDVCDKGLFCELPTGSCFFPIGLGVCTKRPGACARIRDFRPVCGCDGKTYPNDCVRRMRGVSKSHDGAC
jgi:Kazal-type serine protease inhibitor-like protein